MPNTLPPGCYFDEDLENMPDYPFPVIDPEVEVERIEQYNKPPNRLATTAEYKAIADRQEKFYYREAIKETAVLLERAWRQHEGHKEIEQRLWNARNTYLRWLGKHNVEFPAVLMRDERC